MEKLCFEEPLIKTYISTYLLYKATLKKAKFVTVLARHLNFARYLFEGIN